MTKSKATVYWQHFGLERDYPIAERLEALKLYESITDNITQFQMKERGMYPA